MNETLSELRNSYFENNDQITPSCATNFSAIECCCWFAENYYNGYFGPYCDINPNQTNFVVNYSIE